MREIKFRAWDNEKREFLSDDYGPISVGDSKVVTDGDWQGVYYTDKYTIEQYTGLKDKNGKEIYEGDIVRLTGKVARNKSATYKVVWYSFLAGFDLISLELNKSDVGYLDETEMKERYEVIGNIHENPELLEGEKDD